MEDNQYRYVAETSPQMAHLNAMRSLAIEIIASDSIAPQTAEAMGQRVINVLQAQIVPNVKLQFTYGMQDEELSALRETIKAVVIVSIIDEAENSNAPVVTDLQNVIASGFELALSAKQVAGRLQNLVFVRLSALERDTLVAFGTALGMYTDENRKGEGIVSVPDNNSAMLRASRRTAFSPTDKLYLKQTYGSGPGTFKMNASLRVRSMSQFKHLVAVGLVAKEDQFRANELSSGSSSDTFLLVLLFVCVLAISFAVLALK